MGVITKLTQWWDDPSSQGHSLFASEFEYCGASEDVSGMDWLDACEHGLPWESVRIVGSVEDEACGSVVFEGVDPQSLLTYRVAWFVAFSEGLITRLVETKEVLGSNSSRLSYTG